MSAPTTRKPKLELAINVEASVTLLSAEPYFDVGQYGTWALIAVEHEGIEKTWFPPYHVALFIKSHCGLGDLLNICKLQEPGERSARWLINESEVPFAKDPARVEQAPAPVKQVPEARDKIAAQPITRERVKTSAHGLAVDAIRSEALRLALELAKSEAGAGKLEPQRVVESARLIEKYLREG